MYQPPQYEDLSEQDKYDVYVHFHTAFQPHG
jgi:hypothetical protein